jgi:hypothetical protein
VRRAATAAILAIALLLAAATAFAGASITKPFGEAHRDSMGPDGLPSPEIAARLSANNTIVPVIAGCLGGALGASAGSPHLLLIGAAFVGAGVVIGPSAGYRYGDVPGHGMSGVAVRTALVAGVPIALAALDQPRGLSDEERFARNFYGALGGVALATAVAAWDIARVEDAVRRRNEARKAAAVRLGPATAPFSGAPGLAVTVALGPGAD